MIEPSSEVFKGLFVPLGSARVLRDQKYLYRCKVTDNAEFSIKVLNVETYNDLPTRITQDKNSKNVLLIAPRFNKIIEMLQQIRKEYKDTPVVKEAIGRSTDRIFGIFFDAHTKEKFPPGYDGACMTQTVIEELVECATAIDKDFGDQVKPVLLKLNQHHFDVEHVWMDDVIRQLSEEFKACQIQHKVELPIQGIILPSIECFFGKIKLRR